MVTIQLVTNLFIVVLSDFITVHCRYFRIIVFPRLMVILYLMVTLGIRVLLNLMLTLGLAGARDPEGHSGYSTVHMLLTNIKLSRVEC